MYLKVFLIQINQLELSCKDYLKNLVDMSLLRMFGVKLFFFFHKLKLRIELRMHWNKKSTHSTSKF